MRPQASAEVGQAHYCKRDGFRPFLLQTAECGLFLVRGLPDGPLQAQPTTSFPTCRHRPGWRCTGAKVWVNRGANTSHRLQPDHGPEQRCGRQEKQQQPCTCCPCCAPRPCLHSTRWDRSPRTYLRSLVSQNKCPPLGPSHALSLKRVLCWRALSLGPGRALGDRGRPTICYRQAGRTRSRLVAGRCGNHRLAASAGWSGMPRPSRTALGSLDLATGPRRAPALPWAAGRPP